MYNCKISIFKKYTNCFRLLHTSLRVGAKINKSCERTKTMSTSSAKQSTTTKPTTTTTTTTTTTASSGPSTRCHDTNVRRWLHTAMVQPQHPTSDRSRPHRPHQTVLNHRPSSTVLDAIRAIEARQLPLSDPTSQNGDYQSSVTARHAGCRLVDLARRPACLEPFAGPLQTARVRFNALCQQRQARSHDLAQAHFEGQFNCLNRICIWLNLQNFCSKEEGCVFI